MSNVRIPIILPPSGTGAVPDTGVFVDFSAFGVMGSMTIRNRGPNTIYGKFFQTLPPGLPGANIVAGIAPNVFSLAQNQSLNFDDISFAVLALISDIGLPGTFVEVIALQRPGIGSGGFV